ncbi:MAG: hypothetical protein PHQ58_22015 [Rhodoferax sp.]|uniref:McrB family protein n=1 Tax=Rhodoferax sp. TaxID=50421 RepID=UPI00261A1AD0|nr:hypothetical protein [Rhodoferax sp.]MDD2883098.1 hypothetical protein [Rhodoferax sp.]
MKFMSLNDLIETLKSKYPGADSGIFSFHDIDSALAIQIKGTDVIKALRGGASNKDQIDLTYGPTLPTGRSPVDDFFPTLNVPVHIHKNDHLFIKCKIWGECIDNSDSSWIEDKLDVVRTVDRNGQNPGLQLRGFECLRLHLPENKWLIIAHRREQSSYELFSLDAADWNNPSNRTKEVFILDGSLARVNYVFEQILQPVYLIDLLNKFKSHTEVVGLKTDKGINSRFTSSLLAKKLLILTGLAGSGKTKIAQAFARWITPDPGWMNEADHSKGKNSNPYYALVPVGADWTGTENILGYPYGLDNVTYVTKPALELVRHALDSVHSAIPHFLILDEMNLSHVERYFADILSAIESGEEIPLHEDGERKINGSNLDRKLSLPENLFIIGTVNIDETTYMFSPKVLDRANVIEFKLESDDLQAFLSSPKAPRLEELDGKGVAFGSGFVEAAADKGREVPTAVKGNYECEMMLFFNLLREHNAEFGYRTSYEAARFIHFYNQLGGYSEGSVDWFDSAMDAVVVQKFLPKLHGSRSKLEGLLWALAWACFDKEQDRGTKEFAEQIRQASQAQNDAQYYPEKLWDALVKINPTDPSKAARYPLSFDKVMRMWRKLVRDQFVTFAEA